jgi:hypothetical protein
VKACYPHTHPSFWFRRVPPSPGIRGCVDRWTLDLLLICIAPPWHPPAHFSGVRHVRKQTPSSHHVYARFNALSLCKHHVYERTSCLPQVILGEIVVTLTPHASIFICPGFAPLLRRSSSRSHRTPAHSFAQGLFRSYEVLRLEWRL